MADNHFSHKSLLTWSKPNTDKNHDVFAALKDGSSSQASRSVRKSYTKATNPESGLFGMNIDKPTLPSTSVIAGALQEIKIHSDLYKKRLDMCCYSVIGRIVLSKGDQPWKFLALKEKLSSILGGGQIELALNIAWKGIFSHTATFG